MNNKNVTVSTFLDQLNHPFKPEIKMLREIILSSNPEITEHIKWNAPSFCYNQDDRITFRLHPPTNIQLIFHRGSKVKDATNFTFDDKSGLIKWITKDRGTVTFTSVDDIKAHKKTFITLVSYWILSTK